MHQANQQMTNNNLRQNIVEREMLKWKLISFHRSLSVYVNWKQVLWDREKKILMKFSKRKIILISSYSWSIKNIHWCCHFSHNLLFIIFSSPMGYCLSLSLPFKYLRFNFSASRSDIKYFEFMRFLDSIQKKLHQIDLVKYVLKSNGLLSVIGSAYQSGLGDESCNSSIHRNFNSPGCEN